jgi:hypothetical protein
MFIDLTRKYKADFGPAYRLKHARLEYRNHVGWDADQARAADLLTSGEIGSYALRASFGSKTQVIPLCAAHQLGLGANAPLGRLELVSRAFGGLAPDVKSDVEQRAARDCRCADIPRYTREVLTSIRLVLEFEPPPG